MRLSISAAKEILRQRLGQPVKDVEYVLGFRTPYGRSLALHPGQKAVRLWYQPPEANDLAGVRRIGSSKNANLSGPMSALSAPGTPRVEIESAEALHRFIDWYSPAAVPVTAKVGAVEAAAFHEAFGRFQSLMTVASTSAFMNFHEGLMEEWEAYKPQLRRRALELLQADRWSRTEIGSGDILRRVIVAIEIDEARPKRLRNNLVSWQNRYGPEKQAHRALLDAQSDKRQRQAAEGALFDLYRGGGDEGEVFERLSAATGAKYPLLGYMFFLKDMSRFMPIHPSGFDRAFAALGISFTTARKCSWDNYQAYNQTLGALRPLIETEAGLRNVRLIDAHSFCWVFAALLKQEQGGKLTPRVEVRPAATTADWAASISAVVHSVVNTVKNAKGQPVERILKRKELRMTPAELTKLVASLLKSQGHRCRLTGIPLQPRGEAGDRALQLSLDRINSDGHYEAGNVQLVCQFVNFWKGDSDNDEFKRLLMIARSYETP